MTRSLRPSIPFLTALLLLAHSHEARSLTLLSDDRFVSTYRREQPPLPPIETHETPEIPFGPFHVGLGDSGQDSELSLVEGVSGDVLSGSASGWARGGVEDFDSLHATSDFTIQFRVDAPSALLEATGVLDASRGGYRVFSNGVELRMGSTVLHTESIQEEDDSAVTTPFAFTLALAPGAYELTAFASSPGGFPGVYTTATYSLDFSVVEAVPEPGTALLVAIGAAGLAGMRRHAA